MRGINSNKCRAVGLALVSACLAAAPAATARTDALQSAQATAPILVENQDGKLIVNGKPRVLITHKLVGSCPTPDTIEAGLKLGAEMFHVVRTACGSQEAPNGTSDYIHGLLNGRAMWYSERTESLQTFPELVSWQASVLQIGTAHNTGSGIQFITSGCRSTETLWTHASAASNRTTSYTLNLATHVIKPDFVSCVRPQSLAALTMTFLAAGGDVIQLSTSGSRPNLPVDVRPDVGLAVSKLENTIRTLEPIVTTGIPTRLTSRESSVKLRAWRHNGSTWVLAVNTKNTAGKGEFTLNRRVGKVTVTGQRRTAHITRKTIGGRHTSTISDPFRGHEWAIYQIR